MTRLYTGLPLLRYRPSGLITSACSEDPVYGSVLPDLDDYVTIHGTDVPFQYDSAFETEGAWLPDDTNLLPDWNREVPFVFGGQHDNGYPSVVMSTAAPRSVFSNHIRIDFNAGSIGSLTVNWRNAERCAGIRLGFTLDGIRVYAAPGDTINMTVYAKQVSGTATANIRMDINWYDSSGSFISGTTGSVDDLTSSYAAYTTGDLTAPTGTVFARVFSVITDPGFPDDSIVDIADPALTVTAA